MVEFLAEPGSSAALKLKRNSRLKTIPFLRSPLIVTGRKIVALFFRSPAGLYTPKRKSIISFFGKFLPIPDHLRTPRRIAARFWDIAQVVLWSRWCCCAGVWLEFFVCFVLCILFALFYDSLPVSAVIPAASYTLSVQNFSVFRSSSSSSKKNKPIASRTGLVGSPSSFPKYLRRNSFAIESCIRRKQNPTLTAEDKRSRMEQQRNVLLSCWHRPAAVIKLWTPAEWFGAFLYI